MMSGILWIPVLKTFMFTFQFKADFVKQSSTANLVKSQKLLTVSAFTNLELATFHYILLV